MTARIRTFLLGLLTCVVTSVTLAGPPRFEDVPGPAANHVAKPGKLPESDAAKSADTVSKESTTDTVASPAASPAAGVEPKKSILSSIFVTAPPSAPLEQTSKAGDALTPTHDYHKDAPEILQQGDIKFYAPGYRGTWLTQSSKTSCSLKQPIPNFGYAEFRQGTAQPLEFMLLAANPPAGNGVALIHSEPPLWSHYTRPSNLGTIEMEEGEHAMTASAEWAQRLLVDLAEGMQTTLQFYDGADAARDVKITLSTMNFKSGIENFDKCRAQLLHYDFKQVKVTVLQFNADSSRLSKTVTQQLEGILELVTKDAGIKSVDIEIYSLNKELVQYNYRLATRRAQAVRDYLMHKGVDEEKLKITIYTKKKSKLEQQGIKPDQVQVVLNRDKKKKG